MNMHIFFLSFAYKIDDDDGLNDILFSYYLIKFF